ASAAASTRTRSRSETGLSLPDKIREAVAGDTPARAATSTSVATAVTIAGRGLNRGAGARMLWKTFSKASQGRVYGPAHDRDRGQRGHRKDGLPPAPGTVPAGHPGARRPDTDRRDRLVAGAGAGGAQPRQAHRDRGGARALGLDHRPRRGPETVRCGDLLRRPGDLPAGA